MGHNFSKKIQRFFVVLKFSKLISCVEIVRFNIKTMKFYYKANWELIQKEERWITNWMKSFPKSKTKGFHSWYRTVSKIVTSLYIQCTNLPKNDSVNSMEREHVLLREGCFKRNSSFRRMREKFQEIETFHHLLKNSE